MKNCYNPCGGPRINRLPRSIIIAKNRNTFAKRAREHDKKRKAEEKRAHRRDKDKLPPRVDVDNQDPDSKPLDEGSNGHDIVS